MAVPILDLPSSFNLFSFFSGLAPFLSCVVCLSGGPALPVPVRLRHGTIIHLQNYFVLLSRLDVLLIRRKPFEKC